MYGLKQADKITQEILVNNLALYGYKPAKSKIAPLKFNFQIQNRVYIQPLLQ